MDTIFAAIPAAAAISFLAVRESWRAWQPTRHLLAGRYELAKDSAEALSRSWMRVIPGIRVSARYAVAASLHLMGQLEEALAVIDEIDPSKLAPATRYDFDSLEAATLVLLERAPDRVLELLDHASVPEDRVLIALARQAKGDESIVSDDAPKDSDRAGVFHYLVGLHALRAGDAAAATKSFRRAADSPHANVYTRRARAYFEEPIAENGPSSLAPQVVGLRGEPPPRA